MIQIRQKRLLSVLPQFYVVQWLNKVITIIHKLYFRNMAYYKQNMLSIKSRNLLANLLGEVVLLSEAIETYRQTLANIAYFDCIALFRFLDREEKGYLRQKDFQRVMGTSHRKLLSYAFSWLDNMKVGQISRLEFAAFLLPKDNLQLRELVAQRVQNPQISNSQHETILQQFEIFRRLLMQIMNREMKIIQLRRELTEASDYTIRGVLLTIDGDGHAWVCCEDLFKFMKNYEFEVSLRQVEKLVEVINSTLNGKITEEQLRWTVEGFETKNREYLNKIKKSNKKDHVKKQAVANKLNKIEEADKREIKDESPQQEDPLRTQYQILMQKFKLAEEQEEKIDQQLRNYELDFQQHNQTLCQQEIISLKQRKRIEKQQIEQLRIAKEKEEAALKLQDIDINTFMHRARELHEQSQRLKQLEMQLHINPPFDYNQPYTRSYLPRTAQDHITGYSHMKSVYLDVKPSTKKDYSNLTDLNGLSVVQSFRKPSSRIDYPLQLTDSEAYLQTAQDIKDQIKKEREIERQIHQQFINGQYHSKRFLPKTQETANKAFQTPNVRIVNEKGSIYQSPKQVKEFQTSQFKNTLSTANKQSAY